MLKGLEELVKDLELVKRINWEEAEKIFFDSYNKFWGWVHRENVKVLWSVTTREQDVIHYYIVHRGKPMVAIVQVTVDDFYIPKEIAKAKLTEDYIAEKAEGHDWYKPEVICAELYNLFHKILDVSAMVGFSTLSPEEAKKILDMAKYVKTAGALLEKSVEKAIKGYIASVVSGLVRDDRWTEENVRRAFEGEDERDFEQIKP